MTQQGNALVALTDFSPGLRLDLDRAVLPRGAASDCQNVIADRGPLRVRPGIRMYAAQPTAQQAEGIRAFLPVETPDGTDVLAVIGDQVIPGLAGAATFLPGDAPLTRAADGESHLVSLTGRPRLAQFRDSVYLVDGAHPVQKWTRGTTHLEALVDQVGPTALLTVCKTPSNAVSLVDCETGNREGLYHGTGNADGNTTDKTLLSDPTKWVWTTHAGVASEWNASPYWGVTTHTNIYGQCCRRFVSVTNEEQSRFPHGIVGLEIIGPHKDEESVGAGTMWQEIGGINGVNLSEATTLVMRFKLLVGHPTADNARKPDVIISLCSAKPTFPSATNPDVTFLVPAASVNLLPTVRNGWSEAIITLPPDATSKAKRAAIRWVCVSCNLKDVNTTANRLETAAVPAENYAGVQFMPLHSQAVTLFVETIYTDVAERTSRFTDGEILDFTYTYLYDVDGAMIESAATDPMTVTVESSTTDPTTHLRFTVPRGTTTPLPDRARMYGRGGHLGTEFRQIIADVDFVAAGVDAGGSAHLLWDGTLDGEVTLLPEYVDVPPAGCHLIAPWKGRMLYAKGDTLYISNWNNPERLPVNTIVLNTPPDIGGWIAIGEDGGPITGLAPWGSFLLIFKAQGVWRLEGDTADQLCVTQISTLHGCASHETLQVVGDSLLVWADRDQVWGMTPEAGIIDLGAPVAPYLRARDTAQCWAVWDKVQQWYVLVFPHADGDDAALTSEALVLYRRQGAEGRPWAWTRFTRYPGACGRWVDRLGLCLAGDMHVAALVQINDPGCEASAADVRGFDWYWTSGDDALTSLVTQKTVRHLEAHTALTDGVTTIAPPDPALSTLYVRVTPCVNDTGAGVSRLMRLAARYTEQIVATDVGVMTPSARVRVRIDNNGQPAGVGLILTALVLEVAERGRARQ